MRIKLTLEAPKQGLPLAYQGYINGMIYNLLRSDVAYANFVHDQGYDLQGKQFKLFTFSQLMGETQIDRVNKRIYFVEKCSLWISAQEQQFIDILLQSLRQNPTIHLGKQALKVLEIQCLPTFVHGEIITMMSPLVVAKTETNAEGKARKRFFTPFEPEFSELVIKNATNKYLAYYGELPKQPIEFYPVTISRKNQVVTKYKGGALSGWKGEYELIADLQTKKFLTNVGLGIKNSQGFGMFTWKK